MKSFKVLILLGLVVAFITFVCSCNEEKDTKPEGPVTDIDGNNYDTIAIGKQVWLVENLKVTKFNDGESIPQNSEWMILTTPAYCWYDNNPLSYKDPYGALYNWYAVNTGKLCPSGWHVPSNAEWDTLVRFLGGPSAAGEKLKETGTVHWISPNFDATNESGFTALPGGTCNKFGLYEFIGFNGFWWSATERDSATAYNRDIYYENPYIYSNTNRKVNGFSVRCIRDSTLAAR